MGKPGFPIPPPGGRVWEGCALTQGHGEPGLPHVPAPQGDGETGFPHTSADAGRRPAHPGPGPREGLGGRSPPKNNLIFITALCANRMDG